MTRGFGENALLLHMKNLRHANTPGLRAIDERLLVFDERRHISIAPVRPVTKGFLHIDDSIAIEFPNSGPLRGVLVYPSS